MRTDFDAHAFGVRMEAQHMCQECGSVPKMLCRWCLGTGVVTESRLAEWMAAQNRLRG